MEMLEIKNIRKTYQVKNGWRDKKKFIALDDINLVIHKGETMGLVGESGSGKSTLGKIILGLEKPDSGEIFYNGVDILKLDKKSRWEMKEKISTVFQDYHSSLNPKFNAGWSIAEPLRNFKRLGYAEEKKRVEELIRLVGLPEGSEKKMPFQFSGGQLQRIAIARALALDPELVILDEAVSGLDVSVQAQILNLLADLRRELKMTYIFISHDIEVVNYMCNSISVMQGGRLVEQCKHSDNLVDQLKHEYSLKLINSVLPNYNYNK